MTAPEPLDLDRIEQDAKRLIEAGWTYRDVPMLVAEVRRLRALVVELADYAAHSPRCVHSATNGRLCDCGYVEVTAQADEIERGA